MITLLLLLLLVTTGSATAGDGRARHWCVRQQHTTPNVYYDYPTTTTSTIITPTHYDRSFDETSDGLQGVYSITSFCTMSRLSHPRMVGRGGEKNYRMLDQTDDDQTEFQSDLDFDEIGDYFSLHYVVPILMHYGIHMHYVEDIANLGVRATRTSQEEHSLPSVSTKHAPSWTTTFLATTHQSLI